MSAKRLLANALDLCFAGVSILTLIGVYLLGAVLALAGATVVVVLTLRMLEVLP